MFRKLLLTASLLALAIILLVLAQRQPSTGQGTEKAGIATLELPELSDASYDWIGSRIYQNEALGQAKYLTHWNEGEDFPSMGIGHFIWFPEGVDAPFDEQFPAMVAYVRQQTPENLQMPVWLQNLEPFVAPWNNKQQFDEAWSSSETSDLRQWLEATQQYQARFIVSAFEQRWQSLDLPAQIKQDFTGLLQQLLETQEGLFAVIDYYNFKGLGNNPRERYREQGWGLVQVLEALNLLRMDEDDCADIVEQFRDAAASRLRLRVELSPPQRNEQRWLAGWLKRLDAYPARDTATGNLSACGFRVTPYLQNPAKDAITLTWLSNEDRAGQLTVWRADNSDMESGVVFESTPVLAEALAYHPAENCEGGDCDNSLLPFLHQVRVTDLEPDTLFRYQVSQGSEQTAGTFSTLDNGKKPLRFIVYADSETEPESTGKHAVWTGAEFSNGKRKYPVDQTTGYAQNLKVIQQRKPGFVAIAGDLVQSGGEQRDWDEFWLHNAELAASTVILPALGNHDYFGGPRDLGKYETLDSERAVRKYLTYFDLPPNDASNEAHSERYYALEHGPVSLIVLDPTDGFPHRSDMDTNWRLRGDGDGGVAPDWQPGSPQYTWLEKELRHAQENSRFTFVMFHGAPYSSGVHARLPGEKQGRDILSAQPLQALTPLFIRYGVDAVFNGHDEMYEHSVVSGTEVSPDGLEHDHEIHFYDIGIGGDGLRGPVRDVLNPYRVFLAHSDAPELYDTQGVLQDGGKHYGHLEVNVEQNSDGLWQAQLDAVYVFPVMDAQGRVLYFERRLYDDSVILMVEELE